MNGYHVGSEPTAANSTPSADRGLDPFRWLNTILDHRVLIVLVGIAVAVVMVGLTLAAPRKFTARATFLPEARRAGGSAMSGLAAQFGIALPTDQPGQSPDFYVDLLGSRVIVGRIADDTFPSTRDGHPVKGTPTELLNIKNPSPEVRREVTIRRLQSIINPKPDAKTGIVAIDVTTQSALFSQALANAAIRELGRFNVERRKSQAANERRFAEARFQEMTSELLDAERALQSWLERNREWQSSPQLRFDHDRLQRIVALKAQTQTTLAQALEQSRIDEAREAPLFSVIDSAEAPSYPDSRGVALKGIASIIVGTFLGILIAFIIDTLRAAHKAPTDSFEQFVQLRREVMDDFRHPLRAAGRALRGGRNGRTAGVDS